MRRKTRNFHRTPREDRVPPHLTGISEFPRFQQAAPQPDPAATTPGFDLVKTLFSFLALSRTKRSGGKTERRHARSAAKPAGPSGENSNVKTRHTSDPDRRLPPPHFPQLRNTLSAPPLALDGQFRLDRGAEKRSPLRSGGKDAGSNPALKVDPLLRLRIGACGAQSLEGGVIGRGIVWRTICRQRIQRARMAARPLDR